jgi:hypothetical protein
MPTQRRKNTVGEDKPTTSKKKKSVNVVAVITPNGIEGSFKSEPRRPLIAHLFAHSNDVEFNVSSGQTEPEPYNSVSDNFFSDNNHETILETKESDDNEVGEKMSDVKKVEYFETESKPLKCHVKLDLMCSFKDTMKTKALPAKSEFACFWCAHTFENQPCVIPEREVNGVYNVYGNFCMPQCAFAYILHESIDPHSKWERIALLHRMYDNLNRFRIFPSPPRESLKIFGGPLTIESYRATIQEGNVRVDMHMPPMVSILGSIDTKPIDFFDSKFKVGVIPNGSTNTPKGGEEALRLKRSKPLKDKESTLDSVINIRSNKRGTV